MKDKNISDKITNRLILLDIVLAGLTILLVFVRYVICG